MRKITAIDLIMIAGVAIALFFIYNWIINRKNPLESITGFKTPDVSGKSIAVQTPADKYQTAKGIDQMLGSNFANMFNPVTGIASAIQSLDYFSRLNG